VTNVILEDVYEAGSQLSCGSVLLITVDVEPPDKESDEPKASQEYFKNEAGKYIGMFEVSDFTKSKLPSTNKLVLLSALQDGMSGRTGIEYLSMFHFLYADGHKMLTVGGIIGSETEKRRIAAMNIKGAKYIRTKIDSEPYEIKVPTVTRKERHLLDSNMPCENGWQPDGFSFPDEDIEIYREIYRFLPAYAELLI